jgi:malonate-semialdehyde dehydrogenase (acetylating) / methylmalonate-semialdehyde dehydrogenase
LETLEWAIGLPSSAHFTGRFLEVGTGVTCRDERVPLGVVASIVPFNFPIMVPFWTIPIALATGNCIILKPSEKVPLTLSFLAPLFAEAGFPDGAFQLLHGGQDTVRALCSHEDIQAVSFVGSSKVAEAVAVQCQQLGKRVLALGGAKNHLIAAPDCDVEVAAQDIVNSFTGCAGERCMAASVLLTIEDNEPLVQRIVELASKIKPGSSSGEMGPVIDALALQRIELYIQRAKSTGAEILLDGREWVGRSTHSNAGGFWIGPTVIRHSNPQDEALKDEIFGPLLSIYSCQSPEQALKIEKSSPYGNAAAIYTKSGLVAEWFSKRFSAGMVGVNIGIPVPREPFSFGGIGRSRFGMQLDITGEGGVDFFTYRRKITTRWTESADRFFSSRM